jgi:hypothetical protein
MNEDTRIAVCCHNGDGHLVLQHLGLYLQHGCPLTILSPEDGKVTIDYPGVDSRYGGMRCYKGPISLARQAKHLHLLLEYPENYFLIHDADSISLAPKIPDYLYERDCVWSNVYPDDTIEQQAEFPEGWPHVAFQPPYFLNRKTIERMLAINDQVIPSKIMPFIDFYMLQLTMAAKLEWGSFREGMSGPISVHSGAMAEAVDKVRSRGFLFIHATKNPATTGALIEARRQYLENHNHE